MSFERTWTANGFGLRLSTPEPGSRRKKWTAFSTGSCKATTRARAKTGGLGLGLAITKEIVAAMGGWIGLKSELGRSSRFTVHLPVELAPAPGVFAGKRVLIAEDNKVNTAVAMRLLRKCGCECETALNGVAAVEAARSNEFDLIMMDLQMPEADGFAATKSIRQHGITAPIIAVTASAADGDRERCLAAGMNDYLAKPIDRKRLEAVLPGGWSRLRRAAEPNAVRRVGARGGNVGPTVAVEVADGEAVNAALPVAPLRLLERCRLVVKDHAGCSLIAHDNVGPAVAIHVGDSDRVRRDSLRAERDRIGKLSGAEVAVVKKPRLLVANNDIDLSIVVDVADGRRAD
ncbi:MAG: response regulator [Acidobacteria bacterium]|nr:response regulator [Acidobacteriota bacterium]